MKEFLKKIVRRLLRFLARLTLKKYQPDIIGVTGSFGKTSAKEAIFTVLASKFAVRRNVKNYNNEIGLPLTIIGACSGGRSPWGWIGVFIKALVQLIWRDRDYPGILILEMAVDHPGDMNYLIDLAPCKIGVVTAVGPVHLEFFKTVERIAREKSVLLTHIGTNGWSVINSDNELTLMMRDKVKSQVLTYGLGAEAQLRASEIKISSGGENELVSGLIGLSFKLNHGGSAVPVLLPNILGEHLIYAALAGAAVGLIYGLNLVEISQALRKFEAPKGRMHLVAGIKNTTVIDDTYNAGPDSTLAALKVLRQVRTNGRKFAVLGDMLELGVFAEEAHRQIGRELSAMGVDCFVAVGEWMKTAADEAKKQGLAEDKIFIFSGAAMAGRFVQDRISEGDGILVKGSQGMRMEKIVKEVMAEPLRAKDLLVRQEAEWAE